MSVGSSKSTKAKDVILSGAIDGTLDEIYLCGRPLSNGVNMFGSLTVKDLT